METLMELQSSLLEVQREESPLQLYQELAVLNSVQHGRWSVKTTDRMPWLARQNLVPLLFEEFQLAQRHYPIVFSMSDEPIPLALMSLTPGQNAFVSEEGEVDTTVYMPAWARRYPFLLTKLESSSSDLSLSFDSTTDLLGEFESDQALFNDGLPSNECLRILDFCQTYEDGVVRSRDYIAELIKHDILIDGEIKMHTYSVADAQIYNGFKIVSLEKLNEIRGNALQKWIKNGLLSYVYSHLSSLNMMEAVARGRFSQKADKI